MNSRRIQLENSKPKHLEWIWTDLEESTDDPGFVSWLRCDSSIFWISGKPASGKSTLVQYLSNHKNTSTILNSGADDDWLVVYFYFDYRAHKAMPNSMEGMMRSLLLQLVKSSRQLADFILGSEFGRYMSTNFHDASYVQIQDILSRSIEATKSHVCIFLDGLDEYEGDSRDLITSIRDMSVVSKLCVACRPEPIFQHAFQKLPSLRMQDFNRSTIREYTRGSLKEYAFYLKDYDFEFLSQCVASRSEGVILWTYFVCRELIEGLLGHESIEDLKTCLETFPNDMEEIYQRLFSKLNPKYRSETDIMLSLIQAEGECYVSWLGLMMSWLRKEGHVTTYPLTLLDEETLSMRLLSRLGGIVDIITSDKKAIRFIHKTFSSFLLQKGNYGKSLRPVIENSDNMGLDLSQLIIEKYDFSVSNILQTFKRTELNVWRDRIMHPKSQKEMQEALALRSNLARLSKTDRDVLGAAFRYVENAIRRCSISTEFAIESSRIERSFSGDMSFLFNCDEGIREKRLVRYWSFMEWLLIIRFAPQERLVLICITKGLEERLYLKLLRKLQKPSDEFVKMCLILLHFHDRTIKSYNPAGTWRPVYHLSLQLRSDGNLRKALFAILSPEQAHEWRTVQTPSVQRYLRKGYKLTCKRKDLVNQSSSEEIGFSLYRCECPMVKDYEIMIRQEFEKFLDDREE